MRVLSVVCTLVAIATPAAAQDPAKVAPANYTVIAENAHVRVLRGTLPPGATVAMHEHPAHVAVDLTGGLVKMTMGDGKTVDALGKAETATLIPAGRHAAANPGTTPVEVVIVEMKGEAGTGALPRTRAGMKMTTLLEDARVTVHRVAFDPSFAEPDGSTHEYDQVVIPLGASDTALTMDGKTKSSWKRGDVTLIGRGVRHGSKAGQQPADMIIVAVK